MVAEKHPDDSGYERSDLNPRAIGISLAILAVLILGSILISRWFQEYAASRQAEPGVGAPVAAAKPPPGPRLQVEAVKLVDQVQLRAIARRRLARCRRQRHAPSGLLGGVALRQEVVRERADGRVFRVERDLNPLSMETRDENEKQK